MIEYITVADVDAALGEDWAAADKKGRAVLMANVWLTGQRLPVVAVIPSEWVQAGAEIAKEAAAGRIYGARETGVLSKSVKAEVESSKTYSTSAKSYTAGESFALALLDPWLRGMGGVKMLKRI